MYDVNVLIAKQLLKDALLQQLAEWKRKKISTGLSPGLGSKISLDEIIFPRKRSVGGDTHVHLRLLCPPDGSLLAFSSFASELFRTIRDKANEQQLLGFSAASVTQLDMDTDQAFFYIELPKDENNE